MQCECACISSAFQSDLLMNGQEELRSVRKDHAQEMRAKHDEIKCLHEKLAAQLKESKDEMKALVTSNVKIA